MFYMFRLDTAERLSGWSNVNFWSSDVLRASQVYPTMWYANLALAAVSRSTSQRESDPERWSALAMRYYSRSIQAMFETTRKKSMSYRDKESLMMTEALLVGVNSIGGFLKQASKHATNAVQLFDLWRFQLPQRERRGEAVMRRESLMTIVTLLRSQMTARFSHGPPATCQDDFARALDQSAARPFRDLTEAHEAIVPLYTSIISLNGCVRECADPRSKYGESYFAAHSAALETWRAKLADLEQAKPPQNAVERFGFLVMWMYSEGIAACLSVDPDEGSAIPDQHAPLCYKILERLEEWLEVEGGQPHGAQFSFSTSIAETMYWICITCRDYDFRCRAAKLLRSWDVRDSLLWDTKLVAGIVDVYIEVENRNGELEGLGVCWDCGCLQGAYICGLHRIVDCNVEFVRPGQAVFTFSTMEDMQIGRPARRKVLCC